MTLHENVEIEIGKWMEKAKQERALMESVVRYMQGGICKWNATREGIEKKRRREDDERNANL